MNDSSVEWGLFRVGTSRREEGKKERVKGGIEYDQNTMK
jgi:hypothetical protein